jgi:uncharacterized protein YbjT (DUF2867 family)
VFGASGFAGKHVVLEALRRGYRVRAFGRERANMERSLMQAGVTSELAQVEFVEGDVLSQKDVAHAVRGAEAVLHCLGVGGKGDGRETTLVSDAVGALLPSLSEKQRLVCLSNIGAGGSGTWFANRIVIPVFLRWLIPLIQDKDRMEARLLESATAWTSVRLPNIVPGAPKPIRTSEDGRGLSLSITTASTAAFVLDQIESSTFLRQTPSISN